MNPYELLKCLFSKTRPNVDDIQIVTNITINKWLSLSGPAKVASELVDYFFYISPKHYYYLLYFSIPIGRLNFRPIPKVVDKSDNLLLSKVQYILGWTDREIQLSRQILKETVLKDKTKWMTVLGVE